MRHMCQDIDLKVKNASLLPDIYKANHPCIITLFHPIVVGQKLLCDIRLF